ncbi:AAA domain-containing protein [Xenorhabdus bovienii]|uniref:AAA domain-containing protein n=1 Tax=Xenorhabdus bovienii TaxID=40576 RepID=UPI001EDDC902|nr:AAA domain-containing protein [Xenorhabdus bovienii]MCG3471633.1 AAA domain-containing protein [Xenorhabdus bovienii]
MKLEIVCPEGLHHTEHKAALELEKHLPDSWKGYAGFLLPDSKGKSLEIDMLIFAEDRLILVEFKNWAGQIHMEDKMWIQTTPRGTVRKEVSPVDKKRNHAVRIGAMLNGELKDRWNTFYEVQSMVVLTGPAKVTQYSPVDKPYFVHLDDFKTIGDPHAYKEILPETNTTSFFRKNPSKRPCNANQIEIFDNWKRGGDKLLPRYRNEAGYVVSELDPTFPGPNGIFNEFEGEHERDADDKAIVRIWNFNNIRHIDTTMEVRAFLGLREERAQRFIRKSDHQLGKDYLLEAKHSLHEDALAPDMAEVYQLPPLVERLDDFLNSHNLSCEDRTILLRSLLTPLSSMHAIGISHRDLSAQRLWWDRTRTAILVSGLTNAKFPDHGNKSISDIRQELATTRIIMPEDANGVANVLGQSLDVFQLGVIAYQIAYSEMLPIPRDKPPVWVEPENDPFEGKLHSFIKKALEPDALDRFTNAGEMLAHLTKQLNFQNIESQDDKERVLELLNRYLLAEIPVQTYPMISAMDNDSLRSRMSYKSHTAENIPCIVRIFSSARPNRDNHGKSQRLLHFLERCKVASTNVLSIPRLIEFGHGSLGTHVIQELVEGENLEQWLEEGGKSFEDRYELADALIRAIHHLHDIELDHGDLKPENILIRKQDGKLSILLLDMFDLDLDGISPSNSEYAPVTDVSATARDRYAVYQIVDEMFGGCTHHGASKVRKEIRSALGEGAKVVPRNLDMLRRAMLAAIEPEPENIAPIIFEHMYLSNLEGELFEMDSGCYHLEARFGRDLRIHISGAQYKLTLVFKVEKKSLILGRVFYDRLGTGEFVQDTRSSRKNGRHAMSIEQPIILKKGGYTASQTEFIDYLQSLQVVRDALSIDVDTKELQPPTQIDGTVPVIQLWERLIEVERETLPIVTVTEDPIERDNIVSVKVNGNIDIFEFDEEDIINVTTDEHETKFGRLDVNKSGNGILVFIDDGRSNNFRLRNIRTGTTLTLSNSGNDISWDRRSRALERILSGNAVMHDLTDRFISGSKGPQPPALPFPTEEQMICYGLDESKQKAFRYALENSLGVLMGPPGTGKTTLLSAMLHHLMTEGEVRRILVVSQSHVAADEVAIRARDMLAKLDSENSTHITPTLVRLGDRGRVNKDMLDVHTSALQDQTRTSFHRDLEVRILSLASRLKLPKQFMLDAAALYRQSGRELFELSEARLGLKEIQSVLSGKNSLTGADTIELNTAERRVERLVSSLLGRLKAYTDMPEQILGHKSPMSAALDIIAERNQINNPQRIRRMHEVLKVSHHWYQRLVTDESGYAAFAARTRQLVVGTLVGIGSGAYQLDKNTFDLVLIDEAGRATFSELAIAMQSAKRVLLVGDHKQLAPSYEKAHIREVCRSLGISEEEATRTDFERAFNLNSGHMLSMQYRMAPAIGEIISNCFYEGNLGTGRNEAPEWMQQLPAPWNKTVSWIDTSENSLLETVVDKGIANKAEVDLLCNLLQTLIEYPGALDELKAWDKTDATPPIGIITGYRKQVELLQKRIESASWASPIRSLIKIDTIDSYQGSENRIILISLVRHNTENKAGFMTDNARVNVALSRAKERLIVVGAGSMWRNVNVNAPLSRVYSFIHCKQEQHNYEYQIINPTEINEFNIIVEQETSHA